MAGKQGISVLIEDAYRRLLDNDGTANLTDLVDLLNRQADLFDLSAARGSELAPRVAGTVVLRCDGGEVMGLKHVHRCLAVARNLATNEGLDVRFAVIHDRAAVEAIRAEGFPVDVMPEGAAEIDWLLDLAQYHRPVAWLLDLRTGLTPHALLRLKATDTLVAVLDDVSARRLVADAAFYPPLPQIFGLDWSTAEREPFVGWEWVAMETPDAPARQGRDKTPHILVAFTGGDPHGLSLLAARALAGIERSLRVTIVLPASAPEGLERRIEELFPAFGVLRDPGSLDTVAAGADLAVISFGQQAWTLAASGVPALYACMNADHEVSAQAFARTGMGVSLGPAASVDEAAIANAVQDILDDPELRRAMTAAGRMNLDGRGPARIAARLHHLVDERRAALTVPEKRPVVSRTGT